MSDISTAILKEIQYVISTINFSLTPNGDYKRNKTFNILVSLIYSLFKELITSSFMLISQLKC